MTRNTGFGLVILVDSKCSRYSIEIDQVLFSENNSTLGFQTGLGALVIMETSPIDSYQQSMIKISNTVVSRNTGGGVGILMTNCSTCTWSIEISHVTFIENSNPSRLGGGLLVFIMGNRILTTLTHYLRISNCVFQSGVAKYGGGACIRGMFTVDGFDDVMNETHEWMSIQHSRFTGNTGLRGGGLAIVIQYAPSSVELNVLVSTGYVQNTTFTDNAAWSGSAMYIVHGKLSSLAAAALQQFVFENTSFRHNHLIIDGSLYQ